MHVQPLRQEIEGANQRQHPTLPCAFDPGVLVFVTRVSSGGHSSGRFISEPFARAPAKTADCGGSVALPARVDSYLTCFRGLQQTRASVRDRSHHLASNTCKQWNLTDFKISRASWHTRIEPVPGRRSTCVDTINSLQRNSHRSSPARRWWPTPAE